ncbi:MAG: ABC transporter ATP-binding protein [Peptococcaceae bacterium]|nr:ABC transporter ATP-binding protein [Peptococcaceae bacterium]
MRDGKAPGGENGGPLLTARELSVEFSLYRKGLSQTRLTAVRSLSLDARRGEILAVIGSSGAGKSLLAGAILGILPANALVKGELLYNGEVLTPASQRQYRGTEIVLIPQSVDYLDPLMRAGKQVAGARGDKKGQREAFKRYGLDPRAERMFPFQLSGGMARRMLIAAAVITKPQLIVADEPTAGLDGELALETLRHFRQLADGGAAILLITHDIDLALAAADRIAVFYAGTVVEIAPAADFRQGKAALRHPYSKALIDALPGNAFTPITGTQPPPDHLPPGCLFADRCAGRRPACDGEIAPRALRGGEVKCLYAT